MSARSNDDQRIREIWDNVWSLRRRLRATGMTRSSFINPQDDVEETLVEGLTFQLYRMLEEAVNLTDGAKIAHASLPWDELRGMRNRLAHDYPGTNFDMVWETFEEGIPLLEKLCRDYAESTGIELIEPIGVAANQA